MTRPNDLQTPSTSSARIAPARWLVTCDHASNRVPAEMGGGLGLAPEDMARHIAYDVGAAGVALALAERLDAPCVMSDFSRLVIDPNRGEDDPTLLMRLYDGTIIPANRHVDAAEIERRLDAYHRPYHARLATLAARRPDTVILSIHSFTPQLRGRDPRPWHVGVLYPDATRGWPTRCSTGCTPSPTSASARTSPMAATSTATRSTATRTIPGRPNVLIEVRNDLIADGSAADRLGGTARAAP